MRYVNIWNFCLTCFKAKIDFMKELMLLCLSQILRDDAIGCNGFSSGAYIEISKTFGIEGYVGLSLFLQN